MFFPGDTQISCVASASQALFVLSIPQCIVYYDHYAVGCMCAQARVSAYMQILCFSDLLQAQYCVESCWLNR